jgi:hypothetical protein
MAARLSRKSTCEEIDMYGRMDRVVRNAAAVLLIGGQWVLCSKKGHVCVICSRCERGTRRIDDVRVKSTCLLRRENRSHAAVISVIC